MRGFNRFMLGALVLMLVVGGLRADDLVLVDGRYLQRIPEADILPLILASMEDSEEGELVFRAALSHEELTAILKDAEFIEETKGVERAWFQLSPVLLIVGLVLFVIAQISPD